MDIRIVFRIAAMAGVSLVMLIGCGSRDFSEEDILDYFSKSYRGKFSLISQEDATMAAQEPYTDVSVNCTPTRRERIISHSWSGTRTALSANL